MGKRKCLFGYTVQNWQMNLFSLTSQLMTVFGNWYKVFGGVRSYDYRQISTRPHSVPSMLLY